VSVFVSLSVTLEIAFLHYVGKNMFIRQYFIWLRENEKHIEFIAGVIRFFLALIWRAFGAEPRENVE